MLDNLIHCQFCRKYYSRYLEMERIVIFGSSGMTGVCAVEAAVKKGLLFDH